MSFDQDDLLVLERWRGKPKGCKIVLQECGLWPAEGLRHDCISKKSKADRGHSSNTCCARSFSIRKMSEGGPRWS